MVSVLTAGAPPRGTSRYQLESGLEEITPAERAARGKEGRAAVPWDSHAFFDSRPGRPDPVGCWRSRRSRGYRSWCQSGGAG